MIIHPDVLAAHAEFGGDLELMQKAYEWSDLKAEIEHLRLSLSEARATGRREGLSEAAEIADALSKEWRKDAGLWRKDGMIKAAAASMLHCEAADMVSDAIRAAMEKAE